MPAIIEQHTRGPLAADAIDRIGPTRRPARRPVGYHRWLDLCFLHWRLPVEAVRSLVPPPLTIDTFDGDAWVGLVPFHLSGVRPWWFPALPGTGAFLEVNVRTYVHLDGAAPGVWFFSLDANCWPVVHVTRRLWSLNYQQASMAMDKESADLHYASRRSRGGQASLELRAAIGEPIRSHTPGGETLVGQAAPQTLEHFLAERYILYTRSPGSELLSAQVHHSPYPLHQLQVERLDQSLLNANGIHADGPPNHALYAPAVDVEIFRLGRVR